MAVRGLLAPALVVDPLAASHRTWAEAKGPLPVWERPLEVDLDFHLGHVKGTPAVWSAGFPLPWMPT